MWFVKRNQSALWHELGTTFGSADSGPADGVTGTEHNKGHGRLEARQLTTSTQVTNRLDWPYAAQCFVLHHTRTMCGSRKVARQIVHGITSLEPSEVRPKR